MNSSMPSRQAVEALISELEPGKPLPEWSRNPGNETEFFAALIGRSRIGDPPGSVTGVYDDGDLLTAVQGIRLKDSQV